MSNIVQICQDVFLYFQIPQGISCGVFLLALHQLNPYILGFNYMY